MSFMTDAAGPGIGRTGSPRRASTSSNYEPAPEEIPSPAEAILSVINYEDLYADIEVYPEGDVRHRFLRERSNRARYVESLVWMRSKTLAALQNDLRMGNLDVHAAEVQKGYHAAMEALDDALSWSSRVNEEDSKAANAPGVERHYMDYVFRRSLEQPGKGSRGPNGLIRSVYGTIGDDVPQDCMSICDFSSDLFRRLILDKLMKLFDHHIVRVLQTRCNQLIGRNTDEQSLGMSGKTLDILVTTLECIAAAVCFAVSIALIYNLETTKARMIAAPFLSFLCVFPVILLSKGSHSIFVLAAGVWAVLIVAVFLSVADVNGKANCG